MEQRLDNWDLSLNTPVKDDSDTERMSFVSDDIPSAEDDLANKELKLLLHEKVEEFIKTLNEREKDIFENRLFSDEPLTLQDLGDKYQISRERVRQVEKTIIKKVRDYFQKEIPDFESLAGLGDDD
jgi:RNA polymerase sigma-32 factor